MKTRLRTLLGISILLFVLHGIEEYLTGFYNVDLSYRWLASAFGTNSYQSFFVIYQITLWIVLSVIYLVSYKSPRLSILIGLIGIVMIFELQHVFETVIRNYYPGMATSLIFPIFSWFYWKELIKSWKNQP